VQEFAAPFAVHAQVWPAQVQQDGPHQDQCGQAADADDYRGHIKGQDHQSSGEIVLGTFRPAPRYLKVVSI
jgi:hypothetical protein